MSGGEDGTESWGECSYSIVVNLFLLQKSVAPVSVCTQTSCVIMVNIISPLLSKAVVLGTPIAIARLIIIHSTII